MWKSRWTVWSVACTAAVLLTLAAAKFDYFPSDLSITRFIQTRTGDHVAWAKWMTNSARPPWNFMLLGLTCLLSWRIGGSRAALLALVCYTALSLAGPWLQSSIARPRPSMALIKVTGLVSGFSFPSIFALTYASTFGYLLLLAMKRLKRRARFSVVLLCSLMMLVGGSARVALGAHWPSDVLISYLLGLVWASLLIQLLRVDPSHPRHPRSH